MLSYVFLALALFAGGIIQSTLGFGSGIIAMSILPFVMDSIPHAAAVTAFASMVASVTVLVRRARQAKLKLILPVLIANFCIMPICTYIAKLLPTRELSLGLGIVMILLSAYYLVWQQQVRIKPSMLGAAAAGGLGGVMGGLFSLGGIPVGVYLLNAIQCKDVYYATMHAYIVISDVYGTAVRVFNGIITTELIPALAAGTLGILVGFQIGKRIYEKLNQDLLKRLVYIFIGVSGAYKVMLFFIG